MKTWSFLSNPFHYPMVSNYKKALEISTFTDAALNSRTSDSFFLAQYNLYHPIHQTLFVDYTNWKAQGGTQKGNTLSFDQLLELLSPTKINGWDLQVCNTYLPKTPQYTAIFPKGHKAFQQGSKIERMAAVGQLYTTLGAYPALATTRSDVNNFSTMLLNAHQTQEGSKSQTGTTKSTVVSAIENSSLALYAFLGLCINKYASNPSLIEPLFDLQTLRQHKQLIFTGTLTDNECEIIMEHTFEATDELRLESGNTTTTYSLVQVGLPTAKTIAPLQVTVSPNTSVVITADKLGALTNPYLRVINTEAAEGSFKVSLL